jgi:hypothetical protein
LIYHLRDVAADRCNGRRPLPPPLLQVKKRTTSEHPPLTPPPPAKYGRKLATPPRSPPSLPPPTLSSSPLPNPDSPALPHRHPSLSSICGRQRCSWRTGACAQELGAAAYRTLPYSPTPSPLPTSSSNASSGNWHAFIKRACSCFEQLHLQQVPPQARFTPRHVSLTIHVAQTPTSLSRSINALLLLRLIAHALADSATHPSGDHGTLVQCTPSPLSP